MHSRHVASSVALVLALFLATVYFSEGSAAANSIRDLRFVSYDAFTRVVVECDREISFSQNLLKSPDRLYFDLEGTLPSEYDQSEVLINDDRVGSVRIGRQDGGTSRVVIGLNSYSDFNVYVLSGPPRLVVEINAGLVRREPVVPRSRVVVIDPGHGGRDPGAIGRRGLQEKDVALDVALKLKRILETKYAVKVYLTREDDRFLELKERTTFANGRGADLFISLHVNASPSRKTRGIETWFLNNPSNEYDQRVAARENAISEEKLRQSQTELGFILTSLERELKRDESIRLANYLQNSLVRNMRSRYSRRIDDHGVKFSLFYVLVGAEMPAALVEVGFITNSGEELMLRKTSYRKDLANSIAKAINSYLSTLPDLPKLARR